MITINEMRKAVMATLKTYFSSITLYEEQKQGAEGPCFFVRLLSTKQLREINRRYKRSHSFDITYLPSSANTMDEIDIIAEQLYRYLEYIDLNGSLVHALNMRHEIIEGVFHFFVDYDFYVVKEKTNQIKMQKLEQEEFVHD
ncbi:DUF6838 family protein [Cytobacillus solani]|uniref:Phage protein n=1 Tax=Cytobacillus solani TaxID=1637975 RepID=A0A0Q3VGF1_9BACI|nr:hypothetical protein [Cytobacillus solani]KOP70989.1 hypothetical protein AMS60_23315 [Bacillus sp. FJAT-21945]KQL18063.1 hypothetical protein AN957_05175 [Cytobacillus solani]USK55893.1 hypothetical protein LIS82_05020 [Cytobacillus solani]